MAATSDFYTKGLENFGAGNFNMTSNTFKLILIDLDDDARVFATDDALADIATAARVATLTLTANSWTNGIYDAADATFGTVTGDVSEAIVLFKNGTAEANSYLILSWGTTETGLPVTPNGGDITVTFSAGANKVFALGT